MVVQSTLRKHGKDRVKHRCILQRRIFRSCGERRCVPPLVGYKSRYRLVTKPGRGARPEPMTRRRIIIVDDHPLFRAALKQTLAGGDPSIAVEEAGDIATL